jgi:hypothetical protein
MVATTLRRGQFAIVQVDSEDSDDPFVGGTQNMSRDTISFVLLTAVGSGTQIFFTDRTWNGTTFSSSGTDGTYTWTAAADYAAGTVITITDAEMAAAGIELADTGEALYAYQGAANAPTTFLFAVEFGDGNDTFNANLTNTGLTVGNGALAIAEDNVSFGERTWNQQTDVLFQQISDQSNWNTNDNSPQVDQIEGTNLTVAPDVQLWIAGISGGHGLISVNGDATQNGALGYGVQTYFQNTSSDGNALTSTSRFWDPTHIVFDTVAGKFFVVDSSGTFDRILQGNISDLLTNPGTAPTMTILWSEQPAVSNANGVTSIALDKTNGDVYFTFSNTLLRVDYDTANQTAVTLANLGNDVDSTNPNYANELILDLANSRAFIVNTETFNDFVETPPGSGNIIVATTTYQNSILQVANISPSDTNATGNTITELQFTGIYDETLNSATGSPDPGNFEDFYGKITDIDYNSSTGEFWFTTVQLNAGANGETGGIYKATLSSGTLTVTQIYSEGNGTNQNFNHIHVDEETGFYYVTSDELDGNSAVYRGSLSAAAGTAPTLYASLQNINDMTPRDLTVESAPTLTGSAVGGLAVTEASSAPNSGETSKVTLFTGLSASDIDTSGGDELAGAIVRISSGFTYEAASTATGHTGTIDYLTINGTTSGTIVASGITYSYSQTTGVLTLSGAATVAEYASALALVQFSTSGDNVTNDGTSTTRTIAASVFDGLLYSDEITNTVSVTGINDAPVNTPGSAMNFTEDTTGSTGGTPPINAITGISIADADADATTENFTVTLTVQNGTLTIRTDVTGGLAAGDVTGNGTATLTLTGTQTEINTTLAAVNGSAQANGLVYTPTANYNGADTLTIVTNDQGNNGNDPGTTGTGTSEEDSDTKTLNIADVNDAPTVGGDGTEDAADILEDIPSAAGQTVSALFGGQFSDALDVQVSGGNPTGSAGDSLAGIAITANGSSGATGDWQYFNGAAWVNIGSASVDAAVTLTAATAIRFNPALNFNGPAPTLTGQLIETGGPAITNGGTVDLNPAPPTTGASAVYTSGTVVLSQNVLSVNDAPTSTNLSGDSVVWTEGDATVLLDSGGNATLADVDSVDFDGGSLTVSISGGAVAAEDQLLITAAGTVTFDATTVSVGGTQIATYTGGGAGGGDLVFTLDADATPAAVQELFRAIGYTNTGGDDPTDGDRTITWTLVDGDGTANGGVDTLQFTSTVDVDPIDDAPVAQPDAVTTAENAVGTGDVFASNGSGADTDVDGPPLAVSAVNGSGANVGTQITLASGALLTLNADGTYSYDPNGAFDYLVSAATATATGAVNDSATDSFTYTLAGGNTVTVTMTVTGVDGSGDQLWGDSGVNAITGTAGNDFFDVSQGGEDTVNGLGGNDGFYFGAALTAGDSVDGGAGTNDQVGLQGNYGSPFVLGAGNLVNVETLVLLPGNDSRFGDTSGAFYDYDITSVDANVAAGQRLTINFNTLRAGEDVIFNGSAELDGSFLTFGGQGNDTLTGGQQSDGFYFGFPNRWSAGDSVDGQGGADDQLGLQGNYSGASAITFGAGQITGIETIVFMTGGDNRFGNPPGVGYSYDITMDDANVVAAQTMTINANTLRADVPGVTDETLTFDGSAELDGNFTIYSGAGDDTIAGGAGNDTIYGAGGADTMTGGAGNDVFAYMNAAHSTPAARDTITDFTVGDLIDLLAIDANTLAGGNQAFSFIGSAAFAGTGAASAGELRAASAGGADWLVQGDTDGNGVADWELFLTVTDASPITGSDFLL